MKLLITGAFGLVGTNICKVLGDTMDITKVKFDDLNGVSGYYDFIIHAAGYGQPIRFVEDEIATIDINTRTTRELFNLLKTDGKYLFISTSEVYSGAKTPYKESDIGTTTPQHPRACYIEGKRCGEAICSA